MKKQVKYLINQVGLTTLFLLIAFLWVVGCATPQTEPAPDPLEGWKLIHSDQLPKPVADDYQDYVQKLPPDERYYVPGGLIRFFENGAGQHAVKISIPLNGTWWDHVLIYDKDNKRIQAIKYASGRYAS